MATGGKRPWWQMTRTANHGFIMSVFATLLVVVAWRRAVFTGDSNALDFMVATLLSLAALGALASSVALLRRERG